MITSTHNPAVSERKTAILDKLGILFVAGFFGTLVFDIWGQAIAPALGLGALSPHGLARSLLGTLGLPNSNFAGYFVHFYLVGLIAYPVGWLYIFKPVWTALPKTPTGWMIPAAVYGIGLWVFAIGGITVIAGLPFFLNFSTITWVALVGHIAYAIAMVAVMERSLKR